MNEAPCFEQENRLSCLPSGWFLIRETYRDSLSVVFLEIIHPWFCSSQESSLLVPVWRKQYFQRFCAVHSPFCNPHFLLQPLVSICIYDQRSRRKGSRKRHKWDCHITVIHIQGLRGTKTAEQAAPWELWALPASQATLFPILDIKGCKMWEAE